MPLYIFKCEKCGVEEEKLKRMEDQNKVEKCIKCGSDAKRVFSAASFRLKGSGFHANDYSRHGRRRDS